MSDVDLGVLQEKVRHLESVRSRMLEILPLAIVTALLVWIMVTLLGVEHRLTVLEEHLVRIELKLDAATWNGKPHAE